MKHFARPQRAAPAALGSLSLDPGKEGQRKRDEAHGS